MTGMGDSSGSTASSASAPSSCSWPGPKPQSSIGSRNTRAARESTGPEIAGCPTAAQPPAAFCIEAPIRHYLGQDLDRRGVESGKRADRVVAEDQPTSSGVNKLSRKVRMADHPNGPNDRSD